MQGITNRTLHDLSMEEMQAIINATKELEKGFGRTMYSATVNPNTERKPDEVFGIAFAFNKYKG